MHIGKEVSVIIHFKIYLYTFIPIINFLVKNNVKVFIYAPENLINEIQSEINFSDIEYQSLDKIKKRNRLRFFLHRAASLLFTRKDFSFQFKKKRESTVQTFTGAKRILLFLAKFTPKISNKNINKFLSYISSIFSKNNFYTETVLVGSLNDCPELLSNKNLKVITVMESWDHPVKEPNGYTSDLVICWNDDLLRDWQVHQGDLNCITLYPLKLRYAIEQFKRDSTPNDKFTILYPASFTSKFSISVGLEVEKKIINELIKFCKQENYQLIIKPRPNGTEGEFIEYEKHENVCVANISHGKITNPANYFYSDNDNYERFRILNNVNLVINAFTTYAIDASLAGMPVLQLDLRESAGFIESHKIYNNYHIKKYFLNRDSTFNPVGSTLSESLIEERKNLIDIGENFSQELRNWVNTDISSEKAVEKVFKHLIR